MSNKARYVRGLIFSAGLGAVLGGLIGFGLSFTALSPLVIGGIISSALPVLPTVLTIGFYRFASLKDVDGESEDVRAGVMYFGTLTAISVGVGVGLAAAVVSIFPGAMLGMRSLALIGAAIGAITPVIATPVMNHAIAPVAKKVDRHIISPMFEKVFPSEEAKYPL